MKKRFDIFLLSLSFILVVCPAELPAQFDKDDITLKREPKLSGEVYSFTMQAEGSYYLNRNWSDGDVLLATGEKVKNELFKYNGFLDELVWLNAKTYQPVKVDKEMVEEFTLYLPGERRPFVFQNITIDIALSAETKNIFAHSLYEGEISLVAHRRIIRTGQSLRSGEGTLYAVARLKPEPVFYIVMPDNKAFEVRRFSRRSLYRIFPDHRRELRSAFRDRGLRIRSENDLIQAVDVVDQVLFQ